MEEDVLKGLSYLPKRPVRDPSNQISCNQTPPAHFPRNEGRVNLSSLENLRSSVFACGFLIQSWVCCLANLSL